MRRFSLFVAALSVGCNPDNFEPVSKVDTLRVLAVKADTPLVAPGAKVHLEALVADPKGGGRSVQLAWSTCVNPGSQEVYDCASVAGPFALGGPTLDVTVPVDALDGRPAAVPIGAVGVLFAACAGTIQLARTATAPVTCIDGAGRPIGRDGFMWGEKRIVVARGQTNKNPSIAEVKLDGATWAPADVPTFDACASDSLADCIASQTHRIALTATPDSATTSLAGVTKDLVAFFFVSDGAVADDFARADDSGDFGTDVAPTKAPPSGEVVSVWLVLRDDTGGVDWTTRSFKVR